MQILSKVIIRILNIIVILSTIHSNVHASSCNLEVGIDVFGPIFSNTTWNKTNSPYCVTQNIMIQEDVTLTIEPGVVVEFYSKESDDDKLHIIVNGQLIARGNDLEYIKFTSYEKNPSPGDWGNIKFSETSKPAVFEDDKYVVGSIFENVIIEYGGFSGKTIVADQTPFFNNVIFQNNEGGIWFDSPGRLSNSKFISNNNGVIYTKFDLIIDNSTFDFNKSLGSGGIISIMDYSSKVRLSDSTFTRNHKGATIYSLSTDLEILRSNFFFNNCEGWGTYHFDAIIYSNNNVLITESEFKYNNQQADNRGSIVRADHLTIDNSSFIGNEFNIFPLIYSIRTLQISNSTFTNNRNDTSSGYLIRTSDRNSLLESSTGESKISDSLFSENVCGTVMYSPDLTLNNCAIYNNISELIILLYSGIITKSTIYNPYSKKGIKVSYTRNPPVINLCNIYGHQDYNMISEIEEDITATNNYWGSDNLGSIYLSIFDKYDNSELGEINIGRIDNSYLTEICTTAHPIPTFALSIKPDSINFGEIKIGNSAESRTTIIKNTGITSCLMEAITITNDSTNFNIVYETCSKKRLEPLDICSITIIFSPTSSGERNAFIDIYNDLKVSLSGIGQNYNISGKISTDVAGHLDLSVINASVTIEEINLSTVTNDEGFFLLEPIDEFESGFYTLNISANNMPKINKQIQLLSKKDNEIGLIKLPQYHTSKDLNGDNSFNLIDIIYGLKLLSEIDN